MFGKKNIEVNAILDEEIEDLLKATGQFEDLIRENLKCVSCGTTIYNNNIGVIVPKKVNGHHKLEIYCDRIYCAEKYKHAGE